MIKFTYYVNKEFFKGVSQQDKKAFIEILESEVSTNYKYNEQEVKLRIVECLFVLRALDSDTQASMSDAVQWQCKKEIEAHINSIKKQLV